MKVCSVCQQVPVERKIKIIRITMKAKKQVNDKDAPYKHSIITAHPENKIKRQKWSWCLNRQDYGLKNEPIIQKLTKEYQFTNEPRIPIPKILSCE